MKGKSEGRKPLEDGKKRLIIKRYLEGKFGEDISDEWLDAKENYMHLEAALDFFYKLDNDNLNLAAIGSYDATVRDSFNEQFGRLAGLLDKLIVFEDRNPVAREFHEKDAVLAGIELNQHLDARSLRDLHAQSSNLGIAEKLLSGELGQHEWLGEVDLERMLIKLGVKDKTHITRLNAEDIGMILHFERRKHESSADPTAPYTIPLLINCGSSGSLRSQGSHWTYAMVTVNPVTQSIIINYQDSMPLHDTEQAILTEAINYADDAYSAFPGYIEKTVNVASTELQTDGWSCGYRALHGLLTNPGFPENDEPGPSWQRFVETEAESDDLRDAVYDELLSDLAIERDYFVAMQLDSEMIRPSEGEVYELDGQFKKHYLDLLTDSEQSPVTTAHFREEYRKIFRQLFGDEIILANSPGLKQELIRVTNDIGLSADAKIIAFVDAFAREYAQVVKTSGATSKTALFLKSFCDEKFGVELGKASLYHFKPDGLMMRILNKQLDVPEKVGEERLLPPVSVKLATTATGVSKSEPVVRHKDPVAPKVAVSVDSIGVGTRAIEVQQPTLKKNKEFSRVGSMFGATQFCYAEKPGGVEPGFRAIDLDKLFFAELATILKDENLPKDKRFKPERLMALRESLQSTDNLHTQQFIFSSFINAITPGAHKIDVIDPGLQWFSTQVEGAVDKNRKLSAWMYKLDYADGEKDRAKANKEALREFVGTRLARIFSAQNQKQEVVCVNNGKKGTHFVLACGWKPGLDKLKKYLHGGDAPDYNGVLVEDRKAKVKYSKKIPGLGKNLIFGVAIGDRDGMGKEAQNKGVADGQFYGFDYGKPYESAGVCPTLRDDFSFEDSYAKYPAFLRGTSKIGVARHFMYRNYSVFYDTDLSERMEGVHLLRKMITGENPSEEVIKSYPGLRQGLHHIQESTPSPQELLKQLTEIRATCSDRQLQTLIDTQIMQIGAGHLSHFDLYFVEMKIELMDMAIKNGVPYAELADYVKFIDEMAVTALSNNQHILNLFEQRMLLTSQEINLIDKLEKYCSPTSVMSTDGTVFLNTMRFAPQSARIPFQLKMEENGTYTLSTSDAKTAVRLKLEFGLDCKGGLTCNLTPEELTQLMAKVELNYNQKREALLIKPTCELISLPQMHAYINQNNSPLQPKAEIRYLWTAEKDLSLQIVLKTEKQLAQMHKMFPHLTLKLDEVQTFTVSSQREHQAFQKIMAELAHEDPRSVHAKSSVHKEGREFVSSTLPHRGKPPASSGVGKWEAFRIEAEKVTEAPSQSEDSQRKALMGRFESLCREKFAFDESKLEAIRKSIADIAKPAIIEQLMGHSDKTLSAPENIEAIISEEFSKIKIIPEEPTLSRSSDLGDVHPTLI